MNNKEQRQAILAKLNDWTTRFEAQPKGVDPILGITYHLNADGKCVEPTGYARVVTRPYVEDGIKSKSLVFYIELRELYEQIEKKPNRKSIAFISWHKTGRRYEDSQGFDKDIDNGDSYRLLSGLWTDFQSITPVVRNLTFATCEQMKFGMTKAGQNWINRLQD